MVECSRCKGKGYINLQAPPSRRSQRRIGFGKGEMRLEGTY
jgi:hypothetical protein